MLRDLESTPDGGVLCYVLKTGVYSLQGDLRRAIDFGGLGIREESKDAGEVLPKNIQGYPPLPSSPPAISFFTAMGKYPHVLRGISASSIQPA